MPLNAGHTWTVGYPKCIPHNKFMKSILLSSSVYNEGMKGQEAEEHIQGCIVANTWGAEIESRVLLTTNTRHKS